MSKQADREASNAIVGQTAFYAGALQRAHAENEQQEATVKALVADKRQRDEELHRTRIEGGKLGAALEEVKKARDAAENGLQLERNVGRQQQAEIAGLKSQVEQQRIENERLQRVNVESHNERGRVQQELHRNGEALGWLKSEANRFVSELKTAIVGAGYTIDSPAELLDAVHDLVQRAGKREARRPGAKPPALSSGG